MDVWVCGHLPFGNAEPVCGAGIRKAISVYRGHRADFVHQLFVTGTRRAVLIFKESMGLFWYDRYKSLIEAVLNLAISILLVENLGIAGVFLGTLCSTLLTSFWVEPYVLYKHRFHENPVKFFLKYAWHLMVMAAVWGLTHVCCRWYEGGALGNLLVRFVICMVVPNVLLLLCYCRTAECKDFCGC